MQFTPQTVEAKSWRLWIREGLQLSTRRPLAFVTLTLLYAGLDYLPAFLDGAQFWLTPLFLGLGCCVAQCADKSRPGTAILTGTGFNVWLRLVLTGIVPLLAFLAFSAIAEATPRPPVVFEGGLGILIATFFWMLFAGPILWFLVPLIAVAGLPSGIAVTQTMSAVRQNFFVYCLTMAVTFLAAVMVTVGASIAAVLLYPLLCCAMYTSYRHIWFDRAQNEPEKARARLKILAPA